MQISLSKLLIKIKLWKIRRDNIKPPEGWREQILHLYPKDSPLLNALKDAPKIEDPKFKWWLY